jgi:hypothetical protein
VINNATIYIIFILSACSIYIVSGQILPGWPSGPHAHPHHDLGPRPTSSPSFHVTFVHLIFFWFPLFCNGSNNVFSCDQLPSVRYSPSVFNKLREQLTISQSRKIQDLKFSCLLQFSAEMPDNSDILVYLMDKLNPDTMILEVGDEGGLQINDLCVNKVLGIPRGKKDLPSSTEEENESALAQFRKSVRVDPNMDVKCNHLLQLISKLFINNDLVVRIFFVVAFNKLLFPAIDNNVRGKTPS